MLGAGAFAPSQAQAQEKYLAEVFLTGATFCPRGTIELDETTRLLAINRNQALFALLGTRFGGDGRTTFALPQLKAPAPNMRYCLVMQGIFPSRN